MKWGAGQGMADFAYITVGTGIGVGLIVNGAADRAASAIASSAISASRGCRATTGPAPAPITAPASKGWRQAARSRSGSAAARPDWRRIIPSGRRVAHALAQLCHVIVCAAAPRRIVIGGGVVSGNPHLLPRIEKMLIESLAGYVLLPGSGPYVTAPGLGDRAGPLGPIALAAVGTELNQLRSGQPVRYGPSPSSALSR